MTVEFLEPFAGKIKTYFTILPANVTNINLSNKNNGIQITWKKDSSVTGYQIYKSTNDGNYVKIKTTTSNGEIKYIDKNVVPGKKYQYKIRGYKKVNNSVYYGKFNIIKKMYRISTPSAMKILNYEEKIFDLKWEKYKGISGYEIEYCSNSKFDGGKTIIYTTPNTTGRKLQVSKKNTIYYFKVRTYRSVNNVKFYSEWSDVVKLNSSNMINKINELKCKYISGKYWNNGGVTSTPCDHVNKGYDSCNVYTGITNTVFTGEKVIGTQCLGFASMCSYYVFGKATPVKGFLDFDEIRIGDQVRTNKDSHSLFVIGKYKDYIVVAEVNADYKTCKIEWGRKVSREELREEESWYIRRYN